MARAVTFDRSNLLCRLSGLIRVNGVVDVSLWGMKKMRHVAETRWGRWACALLILVCLAGCGSRGIVRSELAGGRSDAPRRVLVVPADFVITEVTFGKTEERVVSAEKKAAKALAAHVQDLGRSQQTFQLVSFDDLSEEDQALVLQHRALFATMVSQMLLVKEKTVDAWSTKADYFDYTLGAGMADVARRHQLDTALLVVGKDKVRSTSRKVFDAITSVLPVGESLSAQPAAVVLGVIDVATGNVLMFDSDMANRKALTDEEDVKEMAEAVLSDFRRSLKSREGR